MKEIISHIKTKDETILTLEKSKEKLEKEAESLRQEKLKLNAELQEALRGKQDIMTAMEENMSKAQIDRLLWKKRTVWSNQDFESAIILMGLGIKGYQYTRLHYKYPLPCVSAVQRFLAKVDFEPGELNLVLSLMEYMAPSMPAIEKLVSLSCDEMYVRKTCSYDKKRDIVVGPCTQVQVFMVRSVFGSWKNPIFYGFDTPVTPALFSSLVTRLHKAGYTVIASVCDSAPPNKKMYRQMGSTVKNPVIYHPVMNTPIVCLHDPPHNVKLCRNYLLDCGILLNPKERRARVATKDCLYDLVQLTGDIDGPPHDVRIEHLLVKGSDRQNVKKATQVLSPKTAESLRFTGERGLLKATNYKVLKFFVVTQHYII